MQRTKLYATHTKLYDTPRRYKVYKCYCELRFTSLQGPTVAKHNAGARQHGVLGEELDFVRLRMYNR